MPGPAFIHEAELPLEIRGFEINTALDVFKLTRELDARLALSLEEYGYVRRPNIVLSDGQIVDGWVKI